MSSLASVERAMDTVERGRMQQPHGRLCENSPSELKLSSTPTQSQSNTAPNAEDEAAMTFTSIKSPKDCLFKILTDDQANSMIDELLRSKTFWSDAKSMLWKCWSKGLFNINIYLSSP